MQAGARASQQERERCTDTRAQTRRHILPPPSPPHPPSLPSHLPFSLTLAHTDIPRPQQTSKNGWKDADSVFGRRDLRSFPFLPSFSPPPAHLHLLWQWGQPRHVGRVDTWVDHRGRRPVEAALGEGQCGGPLGGESEVDVVKEIRTWSARNPPLF